MSDQDMPNDLSVDEMITIPEGTVYEVVEVVIKNGVTHACLHWKDSRYPGMVFQQWVTESEYHRRFKKLDS